jgi:hypothetical protein
VHPAHKARLLLSIAEYMRLAERPNDAISLVEIEKAASRWSRHNLPSPKSSHAKRSREYFIAQGAGWLTFLNRLQTVPEPVTVCGRMLGEFRSSLRELSNKFGCMRGCTVRAAHAVNRAFMTYATMSSSGLCRVDPKTIDLSGL